MKRIALALVSFSMLASVPTAPAFAQRASSSEAPAVKMSRSGICHPKGGTYYSRTIHFTPYRSMEACIRAGGRAPLR